MRLFFGYDHPNSGTWSVQNAIARALEGMGHTIVSMAVPLDKEPAGMDLSLSGFDVAHFWNKRSYQYFAKEICVPFGFTSHGFGATGIEQKKMRQYYVNYFKSTNPDWMHVMDSFTLSILGQDGLYPFWTPQCITQDGFHRLEPPVGCTVGCIGHDGDGYKRHEMIGLGAKLAELPFLELNSSNGEVDKAGVIELYRQMGVYVNAAFGACGPVPPQEALLCGRPVVTTRIDTMVGVVQSGVNGEFFDGSPKDLAKKLRLIAANPGKYYEGTAKTVLYSAEESAKMFLEGIENNL